MAVARSLSLLLILLVVGACASSGGSAALQSPARGQRTTVEVTNDSHADVVVYVLRSGMRFRLGHVASLEVKQFVVPPLALPPTGTIQLLADPIGITAAHVTEPIPVLHGSEIDFRVKKNISNSYYAVRSP